MIAQRLATVEGFQMITPASEARCGFSDCKHACYIDGAADPDPTITAICSTDEPTASGFLSACKHAIRRLLSRCGRRLSVASVARAPNQLSCHSLRSALTDRKTWMGWNSARLGFSDRPAHAHSTALCWPRILQASARRVRNVPPSLACPAF